MGLTEGHWFEDEEQLTERQLEQAIEDEKTAYETGYKNGLCDSSKWISVKDRLPEECEDVLIYNEHKSAGINGTSTNKTISIGWHVGGRWHVDMKCRVKALFWMPLPSTDGLDEIWKSEGK